MSRPFAAPPHDRGRRLVRLGSRFRQPRARCHRDRDRYARGERRGDRRFHAGDQDPRIIAGTEARRELVDRVDRGNREHALDRGNHPTVDVDVALDPLGTHDEPRAERPSIADPIARSNTCTLRDCVDGDQGRIRVGLSGDDADGTPVERRIGRLLAGGEKTIRIEVEPARSHHGAGDVSTRGPQHRPTRRVACLTPPTHPRESQSRGPQSARSTTPCGSGSRRAAPPPDIMRRGRWRAPRPFAGSYSRRRRSTRSWRSTTIRSGSRPTRTRSMRCASAREKSGG